MSQALVSILMPAFNEEKFIGEAIDSILAQSYQNWELLVLDDCSTDGTWEIIQSIHDVRIRKFQNSENQKYQACCNRLFNEVSGSFITFLDADDTCAPNRLQACLDLLSNSNADYLTTDYDKLHSASNTTSQHTFSINHNRFATDLNYYPTICCATIFATAELVRKSGGYSSVFAGFGADDYHWVFRLSRLGKGVHLNESLYTYRIHGDQMRNEVNAEHFVCHDLDKEIRKRLVLENLDLTLPENSDLVITLKSELLKPYEVDSTKILRERSIQELNNGNWTAAFNTMRNAVFKSALTAANWSRAFYILYVMARRTVGGNPQP